MQEMNFVAHGAGGGPEVLTLQRCAVPSPGAGQVLIKVAVAGVNRPDCLQRAGLYHPPLDASPILGLECAGEVVAIGEGVVWPSMGTAVCALTHGGAYAEYVLAEADQCLPVPQGYSLCEAAAMPENYFTTYHNVIERGLLQKGERFLVHGGSSGIGLSAISLAKAWGAEQIITTVGSAEKAAACLAAGATHTINYKTEDWAAEVKKLTEKKGVNLVLDMVGGPYIEQNLASLSDEGRLVQIAFLQGPKASVNFAALMMRRLTFTGSTLRPRSKAVKAGLASALRAKVWPLCDGGQIRPVIHQVFPLKQAAEAHALMESSTHIGKIMLQVSD
ncbi:MAG: Phthiocerol synthesis polyketide synthase type PpsC [Pseudomonadota bacterium]|jgi:putative PIG3 family NAD(P)H quinone oxidoreductase